MARIESLKIIDSCKYGQVVFDKDAKVILWRKDSSLTKFAGTIG
jgi:hypothetical protein